MLTLRHTSSSTDIVKAHAVWISETEKVHARMHRIPDDLLNGLLTQRIVKTIATDGIVGEMLEGAFLTPGHTQNVTLEGGSASLAAAGFAMTAWFSGGLVAMPVSDPTDQGMTVNGRDAVTPHRMPTTVHRINTVLSYVVIFIC